MHDDIRSIGGYRKFWLSGEELEREKQIKESRKLRKKQNADTRKKYAKLLRLIPYYPKTVSRAQLKAKLGLPEGKLTSALVALDNAGCLLVQDGPDTLCRLKEDLSNVD